MAYDFLCRNSSKSQQEMLLELTWAIWPELPAYGRKAAQFVDLLGYFSLKTPQTEKKVCPLISWIVITGKILGCNCLEDCYIYIAKYCFKVVSILI